MHKKPPVRGQFLYGLALVLFFIGMLIVPSFL